MDIHGFIEKTEKESYDMYSKELREIIEILKFQGNMSFIESASAQQISEFEKKYNIEFPFAFKEWLLFSDGGECFLPAGVQFYGVAHKPFIDINDNNRPNENYIVIGALASGDPILFEKSKQNIFIFNQTNEVIEPDEIYDDFFSFLNDLTDILEK